MKFIKSYYNNHFELKRKNYILHMLVVCYTVYIAIANNDARKVHNPSSVIIQNSVLCLILHVQQTLEQKFRYS